jgi:hypothetical protein
MMCLVTSLLQRPIKVAPETIEVIAKALEKASVEFIAENGGGVGVRLKKRKR